MYASLLWLTAAGATQLFLISKGVQLTLQGTNAWLCVLGECERLRLPPMFPIGIEYAISELFWPFIVLI